jgi:hypothetical protein
MVIRLFLRFEASLLLCVSFRKHITDSTPGIPIYAIFEWTPIEII